MLYHRIYQYNKSTTNRKDSKREDSSSIHYSEKNIPPSIENRPRNFIIPFNMIIPQHTISVSINSLYTHNIDSKRAVIAITATKSDKQRKEGGGRAALISNYRE